MTIDDAVKNILFTYAKHGITETTVRSILQSGLNLGLSLNACYNGMRMQLAMMTDEHELFTTEDVAEMTGETKEELSARIEQYRQELIEAGENPDDYFQPIEPQKPMKLFLPNGVK